jgi:hypothetical protein
MVVIPKPTTIEDVLTLFPGVTARARYFVCGMAVPSGKRAPVSVCYNVAPPHMASRLLRRMEAVQTSGHLRLGTRPHQENAMSKKTAQNMPWRVVGTHVIPNNDLREHSLTDCWCRPEDDDGVIIHHSLDRRELYEYGERKLS